MTNLTSNQNTGRDPNAQGPSPLDLLQRQNERLMEFLRSFIAGSESQDFRPWGRQLYRELYSGTHETRAPLTDLQCRDVVHALEARDWRGITLGDIRLFDELITSARGAQETSVTPNECQNLNCRRTGKCVGILPCVSVHPPWKAPVKPTEACPAVDDTQHEEHKGKCVYCGAPMPVEKVSAKPWIRGGNPEGTPAQASVQFDVEWLNAECGKQCSYCFGDKTVSMSDGSKRRCDYCGGTGVEPAQGKKGNEHG